RRTFAVSMVSRPPWGMASRALTARLSNTCSSWPGSALTGPRSAARWVTSATSSPSSRRSILSMLATMALTSRTLGASTWRRLNLDVHVDQRAVLAAVPVAAERPPVLPTQGFLEPRQLGRRADVPDGHREELLLRVAVAGHGGGVHRQEAQRLAVVDPHRFGVRLKQQAVAP